MKKILLIGCGNIGALYDINNNEVLTYAKAFSTKGCTIFVHDMNEHLLKIITDKYKYQPIYSAREIDYSMFELICIATSTNVHFKYLKDAIENNVPTIICEKPISTNLFELNELKNVYLQGNSTVYVNYIRRFQSSFIRLKKIIKETEIQNIKKINFRYKKGFLNNGSHGLDLIQFLFDYELKLNDSYICEKVYDFFKDDPTCSIISKEKGFIFNVQGFSNINYNIFEIDLFFEDTIISILEGGNLITIKSENKTEIFERNALKDYMIPIIDLILSKNGTTRIQDNFLESLELNKKMISLI